MKTKLSLKLKLQVFYMWMKQSTFGIVEVCEKCNSTKIKVKNSNKNNDGYYCATYKCMNCGSECEVEERWSK